jgi:arginine N-succinyltransferase
LHGNQFIADMMPKYPVYVALLPEAAQAVIGKPHQAGEAAQKLLANEGFQHSGYVDIFDGGPTMDARTSDIRTVREAARARIAGFGEDGAPRLVAHGQLAGFHVAALPVSIADKGLTLPADRGFETGDEVLHAPF